ECVDLFVVNAKYLGLLQTIAGAETLVSIDQVIDELPNSSHIVQNGSQKKEIEQGIGVSNLPHQVSPTNWDRTCFFIAPIGDEGSEARKHSDLFLSSILEPALKEFGVDIVRS